MPTKREREYYELGWVHGERYGRGDLSAVEERGSFLQTGRFLPTFGQTRAREVIAGAKKKRKLSAWNKFVKANSKKPRFRLRSGSPNLKKLGVAFRKTPAGKKKRR